MKLLIASIAISLLSAVWFSLLIDRVLYGPPDARQYVDMQNEKATEWPSRWNMGGKV